MLVLGLNYAPEVVGIAPYNTELSEHLVARGHKVTVLTSVPYYPHWQVDQRYRRRSPFLVEWINGVRVLRSPFILPGRKPTAWRRILFDSSLALTTLLASTAIGSIDIVICVSPPLQLGVTAWLIARPRGAALLLHLQDLVPEAAISTGMMREGRAVRLARRLESFVYSRADHITVITEGFRDSLLSKEIPEQKIRLLPNWVETSRFDAARDSGVRAALGATDGETLVVHAGNMGAKQALETVVDAAARLKNEAVALALVGDGNARVQLEHRAANLGLSNLRFVPLQADFPRLLAAADVLLVTQRSSVRESVAPSKLLSYMAAGKPVIAAVDERSEAGRMMSAARCGLVVRPEDSVALAHAILQLRQRPDRGASFGEAGRAHAKGNFECAHVLEQWDALLADLCPMERARRSAGRP